MTRPARRPSRPLKEWIFPLGIPLAWRQLVQEKKRFAAAVAGITVAVAMMLFQVGLKSALFAQVVAPIREMRADVVLVSSQFEYLGSSHDFPKARLISAQGYDASVTGATSLYLGSLPFKNPETGRARDIFILAFDPAEQPFTNPEILAQQDKLKLESVVLFDRLSRADYGPVPQLLDIHGGQVDSEVADRHVQIEGLFNMGVTFAADGNLLMGRDTYLKVSPGARAEQISLGLLTLKPGANATIVAKKLEERLPDDVAAFSYEDFIAREEAYWAERTPIGFVITASMLVSLIVGAVIVYQILYTDVTDHLPEYATLKAIGFTDGYFIRLVLQESVILSVTGCVPGLVLAAGLYWATRTYGHMPAYLTCGNVALVFGLALLMCLLAGALATRKLRRANPADIY
ncbi:MAG TPA: ABC transporter permease DevC [Opitutales bacterium]|nr:ABC transporter permease DevC [Opitutales bacterium]